MARPNRIKEIEQLYGEPAEVVLLNLLNRYGTMTATARHLDTTLQTIANACDRLGIERQIEVRWIKRELESVNESQQ